MKNIALCFLITLAFNFNSVSQNLVPNWSFEEVINCPSTLAALHNDCADWYFGIQIPGLPWNEWPSPDWFHSCAPNPGIAPPNTLIGYQEPCDGAAMSGLITYHKNTLNTREIMSVELLEDLEINELYLVEFQAARSSKLQAPFATNNLGVRFSSFPYYLSSESAITNWSHYRVEDVLEDTLNWTDISFEFMADSAYRYFHIGNFYVDSLTETISIPDDAIGSYAYYFIDCISIMKSLQTSDTDAQSEARRPLFPNPAKEHFLFDDQYSIRSLKIFDLQGRIVVHLKELGTTQSTVDISKLSEGLYIVEIEDDKNKITSFKLIKTK